MYKVLLVNPPRDHLVHLDTPGNVDLGEISSFPPIGLMYLAEALRRHGRQNGCAGIDVRIIDAVAEKLSRDDVVQRACGYEPNVIGLTAFTYTFYDVVDTARGLKAARPDVPIMVGGPHMHLFAGETLEHDCFDVGVIGDGEEVIGPVCDALVAHQTLPALTGVIYRNKGVVQGTWGQAAVSDPDAISVPGIDLLDASRYYSSIGKKGAVGTICTSRGCPFRCTFCQVPHRTYKMRSAASVVEEMQAYVDRGVTDFFFFDDLFNVSTKRVIAICDEIERRDLKVTWMFRGRADKIDEEMLRRARETGCHTISIGIEAATDEGLAEIKKKLTMDQAYRAVKLIRKHGIACSTNWIIGFPHQRTVADLDHLLRTAIRTGANYAQFSVLQCMPGSALYDQAVAEGGLDPNAWRNYVLNPVPSFSPPIWEKHFTKSQMFAFYEQAFKRFYLRPRVIFQELLKIRDLSELLAKARSFKTVFLG